jgi:CBS domain-containing protein
MTVASVLKHKGTHVETIRPDARVRSAVWALHLKGIGALVVSDDDRTVLGIVSERDVVRGLTEHGARLLTLPVSQLMTAPVITCAPDSSINAVMELMTRHRVRHLPVLDHDHLVGIVSIGDVVKHRLEEMELETNVLREAFIVSH